MVWSISVSESGLVLLYKRWSGWSCTGGGEGGREVVTHQLTAHADMYSTYMYIHSTQLEMTYSNSCSTVCVCVCVCVHARVCMCCHIP